MPTRSINEIFIKNLNKYLKKANMSYSDLADKLSISKSTISMWVAGKSMPRMDVLDKLADIFDISSASLIVDGENYILKDGDGFIFDSKTGQYVPYNGKYIDVNDDEPMTIQMLNWKRSESLLNL